MGEKNPMYGVQHSKKSKQKMSDSKIKLYKEHPETIVEIALSQMKKRGLNHIKCVETDEIFISSKSAWKKYGGNPERVAGKNKKTGRRGQAKYSYEWIKYGTIPVEQLIFIEN